MNFSVCPGSNVPPLASCNEPCPQCKFYFMSRTVYKLFLNIGNKMLKAYKLSVKEADAT